MISPRLAGSRLGALTSSFAGTGNIPAKYCNKVVLPAPFSPRITVHCATLPSGWQKSSVTGERKVRAFCSVKRRK